MHRLPGICLGLVLLLLLSNTTALQADESGEIRLPGRYLKQCPVADGFDFPVGKPDAKKYYNAQKFGRNFHLGDDWNGTGGGNTDLGDPVYAIANGIVVSARTEPDKWGKVIRIIHNIGSREKPRYIESVYAHLREFKVRKGTRVRRGQLIGTIGTANGAYWAHLHLEIRSTINMPIGTGYSRITTGYLDPTKFIRANRPKRRQRRSRRRTQRHTVK